MYDSIVLVKVTILQVTGRGAWSFQRNERNNRVLRSN